MRTPCAAAVVVLLSLLGGHAAPAAQAPGAAFAASPRLVVLLSLDQMRDDYIERYGHQWTAGLRRLVAGGARFVDAAYPYLNTVTCPGHATIGTGTFPRTHGMILNAWWDRAQARSVDCMTDPTATAIAYNTPAEKTTAFSARDLRAPTFADELRAATRGEARVVSASVKARSAIGLAGSRGDMIVWVDRGGLTTSTAFTEWPTPFVQAFAKARPLAAEYARDWTLALPASQYVGADADDAERPAAGWTTTFPHPVAGAPENRRHALWSASPLVDEYLGALVEAAIVERQLGTRGVTDFVAMSFSSLDSVGHAFGPESVEVQDTLVRIDRVIGRLLDLLDQQVGAGRYVVALSADHGVAPIPEQALRTGLDAGRVQSAQVTAAAEEVLARHFGPGKYVSRVTYTDVYLAPGVVDRLRAEPAAWADLAGSLARVPGIERAFHAGDLASTAATDDRSLRAARMSYYPPRSGDLVLIPRPYWLMSTSTTTHGTHHAYDQRVPILFYGAGIRPGRYSGPATPADIAPTLAALSGVIMAHAEGRVLSSALSGR